MDFTWLIYLGLMLLSSAINYLLAKPTTTGVKPGTIESTTADEGTVMYFLQGSRKMPANCVWYGDKRNVAVKSKGGKK